MSILMIPDVTDFHPEHTFDCGQCFRWEREPDGSYTGIAGGRVANISIVPSGPLDVPAGLQASSLSAAAPGDFVDGPVELRIRPLAGRASIGREADAGREAAAEAARDAGDTEAAAEEASEMAFWRHYLDLDRDYGAIKARLCQGDPVMERAVCHGSGIRILNQDPWEAILSFLISQNNNIPRIRGCIEALCRQFGRPIGEYRGRAFHDIPEPEVLAALTEQDLEACRLGYRARYVLGAARQVRERGIENSPDFLLSLPGIGKKVADCVLLFSMGRMDRFPVDVWVRRVMHQLYGLPEGDSDAMQAYAARHFAPYGGIAQQYLFHYIRKG